MKITDVVQVTIPRLPINPTAHRPGLAVHPGVYNGVDGYWVMETSPGQGPGGTCGVRVLAACTTWDAMLAAHALLSLPSP